MVIFIFYQFDWNEMSEQTNSKPNNNPKNQGQVVELMQSRLETAFAPTHLALENQSHLHAGHNHDAKQHGQTHFILTIASEKFTDMSRVQRQRAIFEALGDIFDTTLLHALSIKAFTSEEAKAKNIL